jgi:hypothetical protein
MIKPLPYFTQSFVHVISFKHVLRGHNWNKTCDTNVPVAVDVLPICPFYIRNEPMTIYPQHLTGTHDDTVMCKFLLQLDMSIKKTYSIPSK